MRKQVFIPRQSILNGCNITIRLIQEQLTDLTDKQMVGRLLQAIKIQQELINSEDELFEVCFEGKEGMK